MAPQHSTPADPVEVLSRVHHPWYAYSMPASPGPDPVTEHAHVSAALLRHLIAELEALDPRTLDGRERADAARYVIAIRLDTLRHQLRNLDGWLS